MEANGLQHLEPAQWLWTKQIFVSDGLKTLVDYLLSTIDCLRCGIGSKGEAWVPQLTVLAAPGTSHIMGACLSVVCQVELTLFSQLCVSNVVTLGHVVQLAGANMDNDAPLASFLEGKTVVNTLMLERGSDRQ